MFYRLFLAVSFFCASSFAQTHYLSTKAIHDLCHYGNNLYEATEGGLVVTNDDMGSIVRYNHSNGLPTNNLTDVETDSTGIVWISSGNHVMGLRLSATQATIVADTIFVDNFTASMVALKGTLWVLADGKMHSYSEGKWKAYDDGLVRTGFPIRADENGNLWTYRSGEGAFCFNVANKTWSKIAFPKFLEGAYIPSWAVVSSNFLMFSSWNGVSGDSTNGTYLAVREYWGDSTWTWETLDTAAYELFNDSRGNSFVYKEEELHVCELVNVYELNLIPTGITEASISTVSSIASYGPENKIWIGDPVYGLSCYKNMAMVGKNTAIGSTAEFPYGMNSIKSITIDSKGQSWIMELMERFIVIFNSKTNAWKKVDERIDGITSATVKDIGCGQNGDMWFVSSKEIVKSKSDGSRVTYTGMGGSYIYDKMKDYVWVVGDSNKVYSYSYKTNAIQTVRNDLHPEITFVNVAPISASEFYAAGNNGSNQSIFHYKDGSWSMTIIATNGFCAMDVKNGNELFIGTSAGIHSTLDGQSWNFTPNNAKGLSYSALHSLEVAPTGFIMIGTSNGLFVGSDIDNWTRPPHTPIVTPSVTSITFDTVNNLVWYAGSEGITTFPWGNGSTTNFNQPKSLKISAPSISFSRQGIHYSLPGTGDACLSIFSISGRQLASKTISGNVRTGLISLQNIAAGSLVYRIQTGKNLVTGSLISK